jgi:hypothetical protein
MRYGSENAAKEYGAEQRGQQRAGCAACSQRLSSSQLGKTMTYKGRCSRLEQEGLFWIRKFHQCGNQVSTMGDLNDRFVAGQLSIQGKAPTCDPDERMKPQRTNAYFMNKTN